MSFSRRATVFAASLLAAAATLFAGAANAQGLIRDTEIEEIIKKETTPVLAASGLRPEDVRFYLVADKDLNAFTPGGTNIFLNTGLIEETQNPNQLIGVVAHEAGHVSGGHVARSGDMQRAGMKPFLLTMGLGVLAAAMGAPDAAAALIGSSGSMGMLGVLKYSRGQEAAADQAAAGALERAGQSGKGLVEFFDNLRYEEVFSEARRYKYFQSHPLSSERIEALRQRVEKADHYNAVDDPDLIAAHEVMKAKLDAFMDPPQATFIKYKETDKSFVARYARAIAYYQAKEYDKSVARIDALLIEFPTNPYLWELKGQVLFESSHLAEAEAAHRKSVELKPNAPLLRINLAQALIAQEKPEKNDQAVAELGRALAVERDNAEAWRLLAQAYDAKQMPGQARLATAEYHYALGDLGDAKAFAMRARELLPKNTPDWRRATDIVLVAQPSPNDLKELARRDGGAGAN